MCQLLKKFLLTLVVVFLFFAPVLGQDDSADLLLFQELAQELSQESYQYEVMQIQYWTTQLMESLQENPQLQLNPELERELKSCNNLLKSSVFSQMKLSEQLKWISKQQSLSNQLTEELLTQRSVQLTSQYNTQSNMKNLLDHYSKLTQILQKMNQSATEDVQVMLAEFSDISVKSEAILLSADIIERENNKLVEELEYYKQKDQTNYLYGNVVTPIPGALIMTYGFIQLAQSKGNQPAIDSAWRYITTGAVTLCTMELVYQGGRWVFRWW